MLATSKPGGFFEGVYIPSTTIAHLRDPPPLPLDSRIATRQAAHSKSERGS
jgi:hypothetical protein